MIRLGIEAASTDLRDDTAGFSRRLYGRRFIARRFYLFVNYHMPEDILAHANPRRQRLLGLHGIGAYG